MPIKKPRFILTDIEGTTTSISFVTEQLFPYFRRHINQLLTLKEYGVVQQAFAQTIALAQQQDALTISSDAEIIATLQRWSLEDRKITPLKTLQGLLWQSAYESGELKGHVYPDVAAQLDTWYNQGIALGVFSSGSIAAQKLIFGYSLAGNLNPYFSAYFDTTIGGKRDADTYHKITQQLQLQPQDILFLSDVYEELYAANDAGLQSLQVLRPGIAKCWENTANDFTQIVF